MPTILTSQADRLLPSVRRLTIALLGAILISIGLLASPAPAADHDDGVSCEDLAVIALPEVVTITAELDSDGSAGGQTDLPEFCRVALRVDEAIDIEVWLPTDSYNRRYQAVGGGGYAGQLSYGAMAAALRNGYATSSTDTGHDGGSGAFALNPDNTLNNQLIEDFASRSLIEMTRKAKSLIAAFYGGEAEYSYWNGCSTGGRQGLMLAQRMPDAYDGMQIAAPAINWDRFIPAEMWPQVVMNVELGEPLAICKLRAFKEAAIDHCDAYDGVVDGVLGNPLICDYDPSSLVGTTPDGCDDAVTATDAIVMQKIWDGPVDENGQRLWYGLPKDTPVEDFGLVNAFAAPAFVPFFIAEVHLRIWVEQDPTFDWRTLDYADYAEMFRESQAKFKDVIGTDDPDLRPFKEAGGKIVMWHGWTDQLIFAEGSIDYYERVVNVFGSRPHVEDFMRLFMAPGVLHCAGGVGPNQFDPFGAMVDWVETGSAPDWIIAAEVDGTTIVRTQPLCVYPLVAVPFGRGDRADASSYKCRPNFGKHSAPNNHPAFEPLGS